MTIPTDATHEVFIHDLNVVRVDVRMSALEPGVRAEFERLTAQAHQARRERDAAREGAQDCRDQLDEIRRELGAGPGVSALEAARQTQDEHAETLAALAKARQERNEARAELSIERDITRELRATLKIPIGVSLTRTVKRLAEERDEARRECNSDFVSRIASILGASRDETTLNAAARVVCERDAYLARVKDLESDVCKLAKERDEANMRHAHAKAERDGARRERDEAQAALAKANASLETERIAGRVANEFWQARIATLEAAIRNLAKVLP